MIEILDITKRFGAKTAVDHVSLRAEPGRVTGFLGPNGAGKSTTLRVLLGLNRPETGRALIDGRPYAELPHPLNVVGAMLDGAEPLPERRGADHLRWMARAARLPHSRVEEVLDQVGLTDAARKRVRDYSLGMRQRLGLAAALLGRPRALVLDEPVNGLDPEGIRTVRTFLRRFAANGGTVLLSSHLMGEVAETVDDVVIINRGRVVAAGPLARVTAGHAGLEDAFFALTGSRPGTSW